MDAGDALGLSPRRLGEMGGTATVTLALPQIPVHGHRRQASTESGDLQGPGASRILARSTNATLVAVAAVRAGAAAAPADRADGRGDGRATGASQAHNNMQPYLTLNFCIAVDGVFPRP